MERFFRGEFHYLDHALGENFEVIVLLVMRTSTFDIQHHKPY